MHARVSAAPFLAPIWLSNRFAGPFITTTRWSVAKGDWQWEIKYPASRRSSLAWLLTLTKSFVTACHSRVDGLFTDAPQEKLSPLSPDA